MKTTLSENRRRFQSFLKQKRSWVGMTVLGLILLIVMPAEIWSNSKPLWIHREGQNFFPALLHYPATAFGITDSFTINFQELLKQDQSLGKNSFAIFPINPWDPFEQTPDVMVAPSVQHWLGTDYLGRDVTARLIYGTRMSLLYGLMVWFFSFSIGITLGAIQGYFAGRTDFFLERGKELIEILPFLSIIILVNGMMKTGSFWVTLLVVVLLSWIGISSQLRAQFLSLRKREYCEAARAAGASPARIIIKHILPNALTPVLTMTPFAVSGGIATLAVLDYLGFGLSPPAPSIGELLQQGRTYIQNASWLLIAPTAALSLMLISINLIGESLREAFDPRR
jgi:microcin C transport system permease protein